MKKILFLLVTMVLSAEAFAQAPPIQWQKALGGTADDNAASIIQTNDGGYMVAGSTLSTDADVFDNYGDSDFWIVKLDGGGNIQWQKNLGGTGLDIAKSIIQTTDGGYMVAGYSQSNDDDVSYNMASRSAWMVKLNFSGNIQWEKCLGATSEAYSVIQTNDGGYAVAGLGGGSAGNYSISKLDGSGNIQWQVFPGGNYTDRAHCIIQTNDGGYAVAGYAASNDGDVTGNHGFTDYWIVKLNSSGNMQWEKSYGGMSSDAAQSIIQTSDGGYMVAGYTQSNDGNVSGHHGGCLDGWIIKLDESGDLLWQKCLGGRGGDLLSSMAETSDGGYIAAGKTSYPYTGPSDYWIIKFNNSGIVQWQSILGGTSDDWAMSVIQASDGGFVAAGYSNSNDGDVTGNHGGRDYWIVKLAPEAVGMNEISNDNLISLFPNPATSELVVNSSEFGKIKTIEIYSSLGEKVFSQSQTTNHKLQTVDVSQLPPGIYFITVTDQAGNKVTKKVVKI